jgi:hypothetical protein
VTWEWARDAAVIVIRHGQAARLLRSYRARHSPSVTPRTFSLGRSFCSFDRTSRNQEREEVEVVVAHHERATLRVGDVFLKIDADLGGRVTTTPARPPTSGSADRVKRSGTVEGQSHGHTGTSTDFRAAAKSQGMQVFRLTTPNLAASLGRFKASHHRTLGASASVGHQRSDGWRPPATR